MNLQIFLCLDKTLNCRLTSFWAGSRSREGVESVIGSRNTSDAWMFRSMVSESGCSLHYEGKSGMTRGSRMTHSRRDNLCTSKITQCEGAYKIQDAWSTVMYRVLKAPPSGGVVYSIAPIHDLRLRRRTVLLHKHIELPFLTLALPVPTDLGPGGGVLPPRRTSQSLQEGMEIPITSQCL